MSVDGTLRVVCGVFHPFDGGRFQSLSTGGQFFD